MRRKVQPNEQGQFPRGSRRLRFRSRSFSLLRRRTLALFDRARRSFALPLALPFFSLRRLLNLLGLLGLFVLHRRGRRFLSGNFLALQLIKQLLVQARRLLPNVQLVASLLRLILVHPKIQPYISMRHEMSLPPPQFPVKESPTRSALTGEA